jgi:hypothetical protein
MDEDQVKAEMEAIEADFQKEVDALPQEDETFQYVKEPGDRKGPTWPVATVAYVNLGELQKHWKRPWVWGASVLGERFKGQMITEFGFVGPDGREWNLKATWDARKGPDPEAKVDWTLGGTGTDYDQFATWLAVRLGRPVPVIPDDDDCTPPRVKGIVEVFGVTDADVL